MSARAPNVRAGLSAQAATFQRVALGLAFYAGVAIILGVAFVHL